MSVDLKKRFDRIVHILIQLQSKRIVKAQELAIRFDVSLRTIYRDIKSLEQAGIPIIGEAGTGYSLIDGYRLPPIIFTKEEALSFIGAEKLMQKYMDSHLIADFQSAIFKIKAVLNYTEKDLVSSLENQIKLSETTYDFFNKEVPQALRLFFKSVASKKQVKIVYRGVNDQVSQERSIEPIGLFHENGFWYIAAFCLLRKDYRQFRADRVLDIAILNHSFEAERISLDDFIKKQQDKVNLTTIRISTSPKTALQYKWERKHFGFVNETIEKEAVEMLFEYGGSMEYFARWYLMFADDSEILEPISLKLLVKKILTKSLEKIK